MSGFRIDDLTDFPRRKNATGRDDLAVDFKGGRREYSARHDCVDVRHFFDFCRKAGFRKRGGDVGGERLALRASRALDFNVHLVCSFLSVKEVECPSAEDEIRE